MHCGRPLANPPPPSCSLDLRRSCLPYRGLNSKPVTGLCQLFPSKIPAGETQLALPCDTMHFTFRPPMFPMPCVMLL